VALPHRLRRVALIWWWSSLPLFVAGFATAWAGVVTDNLSVMLSGLAICVPLGVGEPGTLGTRIQPLGDKSWCPPEAVTSEV
jgi:hypothetical protein